MPPASTNPMPEFLNLDEVGVLAKQVMPKQAYDYFAAGAETETSVADNRSCFQQYRIVPRILVDVSQVDTSCQLFGELTAVAAAAAAATAMLLTVS